MTERLRPETLGTINATGPLQGAACVVCFEDHRRGRLTVKLRERRGAFAKDEKVNIPRSEFVPLATPTISSPLQAPAPKPAPPVPSHPLSSTIDPADALLDEVQAQTRPRRKGPRAMFSYKAFLRGGPIGKQALANVCVDVAKYFHENLLNARPQERAVIFDFDVQLEPENLAELHDIVCVDHMNHFMLIEPF